MITVREKKYKVVIIGCGLIGKKRANSLTDSTLVACCDSNVNYAKNFSQEVGGIAYFVDSEKMLKEVEADIAIIATPHKFLSEITKRCLSYGMNVLVEKPGAISHKDLSEIQITAEKNNLKVHVGFNHRFHRSLIKAKELIESGKIGSLMFIRARYGHGGRLGYDKEWRSNPEISGGGELIDQGSHLIDLSRWFLGEFEEVNGFATNYYWEMPVDDNAFITLKTKGKQVAFLQASCTEWKNTFSFEIYGKKGKIDISGLGRSYGTEKITFYKMLPQMGPPETISWEFPMEDNSWEEEYKNFLIEIENDLPCSPGLSDAIEALKIINKIYDDSGYKW
ncbi:Gfo/Idh/MocA family oxidoreductase [Verrucomicrobiales bacterium]|nr:Gfo/Idh/MocA family oxidoreductase [Verrucomicrobiales bacterium]